MLKQEHTIGFCDGVMCVAKILENKENGDSNKHCVLTNGDKVRAMSDEELVKLYQTPCEHLCLCRRRGNGCTSGDCKDGMLAWLRKELENKTLSEVNQIIAHQRNQRDEEIEELQTQIDGLHVYVNKIKSEAYKEFAKRLKDAFPDGNRDCKCPAIYFDDYCYIVDECCEEMVGEENEKEKPPQIDEEQFVEKYCGMCGNQRCMGVGSEMFDGCLYKEELKHE